MRMQLQKKEGSKGCSCFPFLKTRSILLPPHFSIKMTSLIGKSPFLIGKWDIWPRTFPHLPIKKQVLFFTLSTKQENGQTGTVFFPNPYIYTYILSIIIINIIVNSAHLPIFLFYGQSKEQNLLFYGAKMGQKWAKWAKWGKKMPLLPSFRISSRNEDAITKKKRGRIDGCSIREGF